jgi:hypothetical protein
MGLLSRIKSKLGAIAEEAKFPGRPPPHKESENPFYADERVPKPGPPPAPAQEKGTQTDKPWYLDGTQEGWDETDVKKDGS